MPGREPVAGLFAQLFVWPANAISVYETNWLCFFPTFVDKSQQMSV